MKQISILVTIFGLMIPLAAQAIPKTGHDCGALTVDPEKFAEISAQLPPPSQDQAVRYASSEFDEEAYSWALAHIPTPTQEDAIAFATTFNYSDNSPECLKERSKRATEIYHKIVSPRP